MSAYRPIAAPLVSGTAERRIRVAIAQLVIAARVPSVTEREAHIGR